MFTDVLHLARQAPLDHRKQPSVAAWWRRGGSTWLEVVRSGLTRIDSAPKVYSQFIHPAVFCAMIVL